MSRSSPEPAAPSAPGADLKALAEGDIKPIDRNGDYAPIGPTRLKLGKPVIAAVEGPAVAGGMELALWCDLRIAARSAFFGVFNRRFGVPLVDLGTIRLPRIVGHGRALELILTGRAVGAEEALRIGLVNEVAEDGQALARAVALAHRLCGFPQTAMRNDRMSAIEQWDLRGPAAIANEVARGLATIASGETLAGLARFRSGAGRHGSFTSEIDGQSHAPFLGRPHPPPRFLRRQSDEAPFDLKQEFYDLFGLKIERAQTMGSDPGDRDDHAGLRARLDRLSGELKGRPAPQPRSDPKPDGAGSAMSLGMRAASEFVSAIIVGLGIGWALDRALGTNPAFLIVFFMIGVAAGVWNVIRVDLAQRRVFQPRFALVSRGLAG